MPNQRAIAAAAGVNQATVSLALRNDPSIPQSTRDRIHQIARDMGYQPNSYVSSLMAHIRSGRPPRDKGCIALLAASELESYTARGFQEKSYQLQREGMEERAEELGFTTENFHVGRNGLTIKRINAILYSRGIHGLIFTAPNHLRPDTTALELSGFAVATVSYGWADLPVDRVATHHRHNVQTAYQKLRDSGYHRIAMCVPEEARFGVDLGWMAGYLLEQQRMEKANRIPILFAKPGRTPVETFATWLEKWKPEALVTLVGHEKEWTDELGIKIPGDLAMACVNRPPHSPFSGIEENHKVIGAACVDLVAAQIMRNEYGPPSHPKVIMIEGEWNDGETIQKVSREKER